MHFLLTEIVRNISDDFFLISLACTYLKKEKLERKTSMF